MHDICVNRHRHSACECGCAYARLVRIAIGYVMVCCYADNMHFINAYTYYIRHESNLFVRVFFFIFFFLIFSWALYTPMQKHLLAVPFVRWMKSSFFSVIVISLAHLLIVHYYVNRSLFHCLQHRAFIL